MAPPRQLSRLERVVLEIVETEQAYVRDLKSIVEVRTSPGTGTSIKHPVVHTSSTPLSIQLFVIALISPFIHPSFHVSF